MLRGGRTAVTLALLASLTFAVDATADEGAAPALTQRTVHVRGDAATLQIEEHGWVDLCRIPCSQAVPAGGLYRIIGGPNVRNSATFRLRGDGPLTLDVHAASPIMRDVGLGVMISGAVVIVGFVVGAIAVLAHEGIHLGGGGGGSTSSAHVEEYLAYGGFFGAGLGPLLAGLMVFGAAPRTKVVQSAPPVAVRTPEWVNPLAPPAPTNLGWTFTF